MTKEQIHRRLAAILAADVAGYSRLTEADDAGTLAALKSRRHQVLTPVVARHQGRVFKLTGDGVLVEFSSAVNAVSCALELQAGMAEANAGVPAERRIDLRIGVHLGEVMAEGSDLYGEGVNIAARMEGLAEPGGICISEDAYRQVRNKVAVSFEDIGPQNLKNMEQPVRVYRVGGSPLVAARSEPTGKRPSIAVLPFDNMSGDAEQDYFSDGITEDVITELSKFKGLFVIARNSSFSFRGQALNARQIGARLGVRYVVEGSVRRAGERIRITAQLIDAIDDRHIWAQRYDRNLDDIFEVQDEVVRAIVGAIEPHLALSERGRALRKPPENLDAWENYQRGMWLMFQYRPEERAEALSYLHRAIELEPSFASAHAALGMALYVYIILGASPDRSQDLKAAYEAASKAITLDEHDPMAWAALSRAYILRGESQAAIDASDRAIALNPNFALAHFGRAHALWHAGRPQEAVISHDMALQLCPLDSLMWAYLASKAIALLMMKKFEEAIEVSRASQRQAHAAVFSYLAEIAALGHLGRSAEAKDAIRRARKKKPDLSVDYVAEALPITDPVCRDIFLDGLRNAGVPEKFEKSAESEAS